MKKTLLSIIALMLVAGSAFSQKVDRLTFSISDNLPLVLGSVISGGVIGSLTDAPAGTELGTVTDRGCYTVGYTHYTSERVAIGADLTYAGAKINFEDKETHKNVTGSSANIFMLMAKGRCNYFRKGIFTMGGDLGLGVMSDFKGATSVAYQVNPVDFRLGSEKAGGFLCIGFGVRGIFTLGFDITI